MRSSRDLSLPANPSVYVHAPARLDPSMAPPGQDTLTAIIPVGHLSDDGTQDWRGLQERARDHVFRRLGPRDRRLDAHIKFEEAFTPPSWADLSIWRRGSTHGLSHRLTQMAYFRPANRHRRYRNLYFAGASTHPGTGMPMAMVSGRRVAERITAELRRTANDGMIRRVVLVSPRGFCAGVVRAIATVERALALPPPVYVRRAIVHNDTFVAPFREAGLGSSMNSTRFPAEQPLS